MGFSKVILAMLLMVSASVGAQTTPFHHVGTCTSNYGDHSVAKAKVTSIVVVDSNQIPVYQQVFAGNCDPTNGHYRQLGSSALFGLKEGMEYTIGITVRNPDSSLHLVHAGVWLDLDGDEEHEAGPEFLSPNDWTLSTVYDNAFRFVLDQISTTKDVLLRVRTENAVVGFIDSSMAQDTLVFGQTIDIPCRIIPLSDRTPYFSCPDTLYPGSYTLVQNANAQTGHTYEWFLDTSRISVEDQLKFIPSGSGLMQLKLRSKDPGGQLDSTLRSVTVAAFNRPLDIQFMVRPQQATLYDAIDLIDLSSTSHMQYRWSLTDGSDSIVGKWVSFDTFPRNRSQVFSGVNPPGVPKVFPDEGSWDVCLEVGYGGSIPAKRLCKQDHLLIGPDNVQPYVVLNGFDSICVERGPIYIDQGAMAYDNVDQDALQSQIIRVSNVNPQVQGYYYEKYVVTDHAGNTSDTAIQVVQVGCDLTPPILQLFGTDTIRHPVDTPFADPGYWAGDAIDGVLTDSVQVTGAVNVSVLGAYVLQYRVEDSAGNADSAFRVVIVVDTIPPHISARDSSHIRLAVGAVFRYWEHLSLQDNHCDSTFLADSLRVLTNTIDSSKAGTYHFECDTRDSANNRSNPFRLTVEVDSSLTKVMELIEHPIRIHPNPVNDWLEVSSHKCIIWLELYGPQGALIVRQQSGRIRVDTLPPGNYVVLARFEDGSIGRKLVIKR